MVAAKKDMYIEQGATFNFWFRWSLTDETGAPTTPVDLTDWKARMQIRKSQQAPALVSATTETGEFTIDGVEGVVYCKLSDEQTDLITVRSCLYDIELESPTGDVYRMLEGKITVSPNITQLPEDPVVTA